MTDTRMKIAIYGASGYTGRQIVAELARRGAATVLVGRDRERLRIVQAELGGALRVARLDDPAALSAAVRGCRVVINAAGPFELTSAALLEAAVGAGAHYVDFAAEQASVAATFERWGAPAREAGVALAPAMGFYGALGDLLGTLVAREVGRVELLTLAYAVTGWRMTPGSRAAANV